MVRRGPGVLSRASDAPHAGSRHTLMCRPSASRCRGGAARAGDAAARSTRLTEQHLQDPQGRRSPRVSGIRPTPHRASPRNSARVPPQDRANEREAEPTPPRETEIEDPRGERRSRRGPDAGEGSRKLANPFDVGRSGIPLSSEDLSRRTAVELCPFALEPAPSTEVVVRPSEVGENQREPMDASRKLVRPLPRAGDIASQTNARRPRQDRKVFPAKNAQKFR